jgi:hypothetical protein
VISTLTGLLSFFGTNKICQVVTPYSGIKVGNKKQSHKYIYIYTHTRPYNLGKLHKKKKKKL